MGARRNDDADLELREDYYRPHASPPPSPAAAATTTAATATATAAPKTPPPQKVEQSTSTSSSGLASYNPFSYFGLTSPARVLAAADARPDVATVNNNGHNQENSGSAPAPPLGAFPPPILEGSPTAGLLNFEGGVHQGDEDFTDEREEQGVDHHHQFVSSHPWFNQVELTDPNNHENHDSNNNQQNDMPFINDTIYEGRKTFLTWADQKAIIGATFNFANSIIGAGAMGLGGAFAASGGGISVLCLIGFAYLTKSSLDLVVDLSSCPLVIAKARSHHDRGRGGRNGREENEISIGSSFADSQIDEESESDEDYSAMLVEIQGGSNASDGIDEVMDDSNNNNGDDQSNQGSSPPNEDAAKDVEIAEEESSQKASNNESSPLMASAEEGKNENEEVEEMLLTPTKTAGLGIDHPLTQSPELLNARDRYDSLTMPATQPKYFSPMQVNPDGIPVVRSTPAIQSETHVQQPQMSPCTYEELGRAAFGTMGRFSVLVSKALYSFGCLIAYVVVVRDNFGLSLRRMINGPASPNSIDGDDGGWLYNDDILAFWVSAIFMLPLSCPRTMKPLAKFSFISILSIIFLIIAVVYLFFTCSNPEGGVTKASFYENWIEIRSFSGFIESLGCFIFTFVCHHTVNLAYESLPPPIRNPKIWRRVSTNSIALALQASLAIGVFAYLTFGSQTPADVLMGYPTDLPLANIARLLLCLTMVLTFPLPFLTCREMSILICVDLHNFYHKYDLEQFNIFIPILEYCAGVWAGFHRRNQNQQMMQSRVDSNEAEEQEEFVQLQRPSFFKRWSLRGKGFGTANVGLSDTNEEWWNGMNDDAGAVTQALLSEEEHAVELNISIGGQLGKPINPSPLSSRSGDESTTEPTISSMRVPTPSWILPNGDGRQLSLLWHAVLTFNTWLIVTICAIKSPSLGDVLDLVGAFTGTLLAFVLPALFSFKLKGYNHLSLAILGIGGVVGLLGTIFSFAKFTEDIR